MGSFDNSFFRPDFLITDNTVRLELNEQCNIEVKNNTFILHLPPKFYSESQMKMVIDKLYYFIRPYINKDTVLPKKISVEKSGCSSISGYITKVSIVSLESGVLEIEFSILQ